MTKSQDSSQATRKALPRRVVNRFFHLGARFCPGSTTFRIWLHRARGVQIGQGVFIGDEVYLDNEYPECIEIGDRVQISVRAIVIAHTRGPGRVIIEKESFIGPNCMLITGAGRVLRIGAGAVVGAGSVVTRSVPAGIFLAPPNPVPVARVGLPLPLAESMPQFWGQLKPLPPRRASTPFSANAGDQPLSGTG